MNDKKYEWSFTKKGRKSFKKLDPIMQRRIMSWLDTHIDGAENPRIWGKALEGSFKTLWRYRVGMYRLIVDIQDQKFIVLVVKVGKRSDVYQDK